MPAKTSELVWLAIGETLAAKEVMDLLNVEILTSAVYGREVIAFDSIELITHRYRRWY